MADTNWPAIYLHLRYDRPLEAIEWLSRVFNFHETIRMPRGADNVTSRLDAPDGGMVMVSGLDDDFKAWVRQRAPQFREPIEQGWPLLSHAISVVVADVDTHFERAELAGATILTAPRDQPWGLRSYAALDLEGHQWEFNQRLKPVEPEEWGAVRVGQSSD